MKTKFYISMLAGALALTGCSEEFLETEPTQRVSSEQIAEASELNPSLQNANIAGLYSTMYNTYTGGTDGHDDFGQKANDVFSDMLTGDMVLAGYSYGWYMDIVEYQSTVDFTDLNNYQVWRYYYRIIFGANGVIDGLGGNDAELETEEARHIMGQAKAMRAYSYFYLLQYIGEGYNPSEPLLPVYTTVSQEAVGQSTQQEVYDLVVSDLTEAVELLDGFARSQKSQVDQSVARGLLAYTYAAMNEYGQAQAVAQEVVNSGQYSIMTAEEVAYSEGDTNGGFNDLNSPGWMWGAEMNLDVGLDLVSWWGQIDMFTYSYASVGDPKSISIDLYNQIPENDVRKNQFIDYNDNGQYLPMNKFFPENRTIQGQRNITTDYVYMRVAEMYLLLAESAAMNGDEATARQALAELLEKRVDDVSYLDSLSGQALLDEIYLQTRIELWGEGKSYLAVMRLERSITTPANHLSIPGQTYSYDADELSFEIPQLEIQNNPNIN